VHGLPTCPTIASKRCPTTPWSWRCRGSAGSPSSIAACGPASGRVGIIGYGRATACKLHAFGCSLLVTDVAVGRSDIAVHTTVADLLARSDVVILHAPLTPQTHHLIGRSELAAMKSTAQLITPDERFHETESERLADRSVGRQRSSCWIDAVRFSVGSSAAADCTAELTTSTR
jgi:D-isomer specific 2-hydroxyacid dehydrogenase, NAD binding domain